MNYRSGLFRLSGIGEPQAGPANEPLQISPAEDFEQMEFFRSWVVCDFDFEPGRTSGRFNRDSVLGLALALGVAAGFWTAAGLLITRFW